MAYTVRLKAFEGPLDLLLHLIEKEQLDIQDIPIASITAQYLEYLDTLRELDLEVTSEFLVMAATLLAIKARTLLPKPALDEKLSEEESDPRQELVQRLLEYKRFKEAALFLKERQQVHGKIYTKENNIEMYQALFCPPKPLAGVDIFTLIDALQQVLKRAAQVKPPVVRAAEISVEDKMAEVLRCLVLHPKGMTFQSVFAQKACKAEIAVTFFAILELLHQGKVELIQQQQFAEIVILPVKGEGIQHGSNVS